MFCQHHTSQGSTGQPIWLDDVFCASSSYSCLRSCQRCPSTQIHNCQHSEDVTVECGMLILLFLCDSCFFNIPFLCYRCFFEFKKMNIEYRSGSSVSNRVSTCDFGNVPPGTIVNGRLLTILHIFSWMCMGAY